MATWLVIERKPDNRKGSPQGPPVYDVERNGRAFAYDLDLPAAQNRIARNYRYSKSEDKVYLVSMDGGRRTLFPKRRV